MSDRRIYLLDPQNLNPETIAVTFAKTSRSPLSFREIAAELTDEKSSEFNEKWVVGYGHASVAEHAVLHIAVENISRLAVESLESNRLASYTEKSTRYQKWDDDQYYFPDELHDLDLKKIYQNTCHDLFHDYQLSLPLLRELVIKENPKCKEESEAAWERRIRSDYVDVCRFFLPASALANVGMTINARALEHALRKMYSHPLEEVRSIGKEIADTALKVVPSLLKYIDSVPYLQEIRQTFSDKTPCSHLSYFDEKDWFKVLSFDNDGEERVLAASLFRFCNNGYAQCVDRLRQMDANEKKELSINLLSDLSRHDVPLRELEYATIRFEITLDQGAYNELKRHRMMTQTPQSLGSHLGYAMPLRIVMAGLEQRYREAMDKAKKCYEQLSAFNPEVAAYIIPNAFNRRLIISLNLRSAAHFISLRTAPGAHFSMRRVALRMAEEICHIYPLLGNLIQGGTRETWQSVQNSYFSQTF